MIYSYKHESCHYVLTVNQYGTINKYYARTMNELKQYINEAFDSTDYLDYTIEEIKND